MAKIVDKYPPIKGNAKDFRKSIETQFTIKEADLAPMRLDKSNIGETWTKTPQPKNNAEAYNWFRFLHAQTLFELEVERFINRFKHPKLNNYQDQLSELNEWCQKAREKFPTTKIFDEPNPCRPIKDDCLLRQCEYVRIKEHYYENRIDETPRVEIVKTTQGETREITHKTELMKKAHLGLGSDLAIVWGKKVLFKRWIEYQIEVLEKYQGIIKPLFNKEDPLCWFKTLVSTIQVYSANASSAYMLMQHDFERGNNKLNKIDCEHPLDKLQEMAHRAKQEITQTTANHNIKYITSELKRIIKQIDYNRQDVKKSTRQYSPKLTAYTHRHYKLKTYQVQSLFDLFFEDEEKKMHDGVNETLFSKNLTINKFNLNDVSNVVDYFKKELVENGLITENDLMIFLINAFDKMVTTSPKIKLKKDINQNKIVSKFHKFYATENSSPKGKKEVYLKLLTNHFEGYDYDTIINNFRS
jgi:hypothetical protein